MKKALFGSMMVSGFLISSLTGMQKLKEVGGCVEIFKKATLHNSLDELRLAKESAENEGLWDKLLQDEQAAAAIIENAANDRYMKTLRLLREWGLPVHARSKEFEATALHKAAERDSIKALQFLNDVVTRAMVSLES